MECQAQTHGSNRLRIRCFDDIALNEKASCSRTFTEESVQRFAELVGDYNPLHFDQSYAVKTRFGRCLVHGVLTVGLVSSALTELSPGCIYVSQEVRFIRPVYVGDTIKATVTVQEKIEKKRILKLSTVATNQSGDVVLSGQASLLVPIEVEGRG
jgi:acyl dehydratase